MLMSAQQVFAGTQYRPQYNVKSGTYDSSAGNGAKHYNVYTPNKKYSSNAQAAVDVQAYLKRFKQLDNANRYLPYQSQVNISGDAILVLMDYSISMDMWIKMSEDILAYILPKLPSSTYVGLRVIAGTSMFYKSPSGCTNTHLVREFKSTNFQRDANIIKGINEVSIGGNTPLTYSLYNVIEKDLSAVNVPAGKTKKVILITDAGETCGFNTCLYIKDVVKRYPNVVIDVIEVGGLRSLRCLSVETGGKHFDIFDNSENKREKERQYFEAAMEDAFHVPKGFVDRERKIEPQKLNKLYNQLGIDKEILKQPSSQPSSATSGKGPDTSLQQLTQPKSKGYKFIDVNNIKFDEE